MLLLALGACKITVLAHTDPTSSSTDSGTETSTLTDTGGYHGITVTTGTSDGTTDGGRTSEGNTDTDPVGLTIDGMPVPLGYASGCYDASVWDANADATTMLAIDLDGVAAAAYQNGGTWAEQDTLPTDAGLSLEQGSSLTSGLCSGAPPPYGGWGTVVDTTWTAVSGTISVSVESSVYASDINPVGTATITLDDVDLTSDSGPAAHIDHLQLNEVAVGFWPM